MSTTTINMTSYVNGLLTDLTSATFSSSDGTFGLRRTDTGVVVIANATTFPRITLGSYQKAFTDPAADLTYEYSLKLVYNGVTRYYIRQTTAAATTNILYSIPTSDHYSSEAEVLRILGSNAINLMTEDWVNSDTSPIWEDILASVDDQIDLFIGQFYPERYTSNQYLRRQATYLACNLLSQRRGNPGLYLRDIQRVYDQLDDIRNGRLQVPRGIPLATGAPSVRNYIMQPDPQRPMRFQSTKSMGKIHSSIDMAYEPYFYMY